MLNNLKKILIVEDDGMLRKILIDSFTTGYSVMDAADGEMALQKVSFQEPDLIILDIMLPKLNGLDVLSKIRHDTNSKIAKTPVIIISNLSDQRDLETAKAMGIDGYYVKSTVSVEEIVARIHQLLSKAA